MANVLDRYVDVAEHRINTWRDHFTHFIDRILGGRDIFAGEVIVSSVPFQPKKRAEDNRTRFDEWLLGKSTPEQRREARKRWMDRHYGGAPHPIDI